MLKMVHGTVQMHLMSTESQAAVNRHERETVLAETRKAAERQQHDYQLIARRRRLTVTATEMPALSTDQRHQQLLQQILKYDAIFDSLRLATQSHDQHVSSYSTRYLSLALSLSLSLSLSVYHQCFDTVGCVI